jgi:hypothetical protein
MNGDVEKRIFEVKYDDSRGMKVKCQKISDFWKSILMNHETKTDNTCNKKCIRHTVPVLDELSTEAACNVFACSSPIVR